MGEGVHDAGTAPVSLGAFTAAAPCGSVGFGFAVGGRCLPLLCTGPHWWGYHTGLSVEPILTSHQGCSRPPHPRPSRTRGQGSQCVVLGPEAAIAPGNLLGTKILWLPHRLVYWKLWVWVSGVCLCRHQGYCDTRESEDDCPAGKTTIKALTGLLRPQAGHLRNGFGVRTKAREDMNKAE